MQARDYEIAEHAKELSPRHVMASVPSGCASESAVIIDSSYPRSSSADPIIIGLQHGHHFGPAEFVGNFLVPGKHFAQSRTRDLQPVPGSVRTGSRRRHAIAFIAEERHVQLERLDGQAAGCKRVKDMVGI